MCTVHSNHSLSEAQSTVTQLQWHGTIIGEISLACSKPNPCGPVFYKWKQTRHFLSIINQPIKSSYLLSAFFPFIEDADQDNFRDVFNMRRLMALTAGAMFALNSAK